MKDRARAFSSRRMAMRLGITVTAVALHRRLVRDLDLLNDRAVQVEPRGPASLGGVMEGDVIVTVNGRVVAGVDDLHRLLTGTSADQPLAVTIVRDQRILELPVRPGTLG